jgi:hypothetical protein
VIPGILLLTACSNDQRTIPAAGRPIIESFQFSIRNNGMIKSEIYETIITEKDIRVIQGEGTDTLKFMTPIQYSDSLNRISEISLASLDPLYSNDCMADGLQLTAVLKKEDSVKTVHISNFYQPDIGLAIEYINAYVPEKFRVNYDKKQLEEEYIKCKESKKRVP